ncbi:MAG: extracellular solute-binding protein [SAR324 cluster bacterium]|nr:extracellular solute-binding protein [SAR324 cluster bacterium]
MRTGAYLAVARTARRLALGVTLGMALLLAPGLCALAQAASHGAALGGGLKYPRGFAHYEHANPAAPKGGRIALPGFGKYDTLNPFTLKGRPPLLLQRLVFETLMDTSADEPFSVYGLLAESIEIAPDGMAVTFRLNPKARFADGKPVTAADVVFSFQVLRSEAASPFYRYYYNDISSVKALDRLTVRLGFARRNRELPLIAGQIPVLPRHYYQGKDFGRDFVLNAMGSGPYRVGSYDIGKNIIYQRRKDFWGRDLGVNRGRYNFGQVVVKYFRDQFVMLEALKAGEIDFMAINSSKQWARDVGGKKWEKGYLVKEKLKHQNNAGMQGFAFNVRLPIFQNRDLRHALALAFDFEWSNRTLFHGQYTANDSYFANSELAARGLPSPAELALLNPLKQHVAPEVFTKPVEQVGKGYRNIRQRLRAAKRLLAKAGWEVRQGVLVHAATGRKMRFTVTLVSPAFERIVEPYLNKLRRLGVQADIKVVDDAVYEKLVKSHKYEMIVANFGQSQSPGNEQRDYWHSSSAAQEGSRNLIGVSNPAVDALVEAIIKAPGREALVTATRALDRVLWHEYYVVPHWYIAAHRVAYWNKLGRPAQLPLYYGPLRHLMDWWVDPAKARGLDAARNGGRPFRPAR